MGSKIKIVSDQPLVRGEETPVKVQISFDKETKVRGIRALVHGAERTEATYTETSTDHEGKTTTTTRTAVEEHDIINEKLLLHGEERLGFFSRIGDSLATWVGGGKHEVLEPGDQEFTVNVKIPENAPASFSGKKCSVFYKVDVSVDLPIKMDWFKSLALELPTVKPGLEDAAPIHVTFPGESGRSFWDKTFGKDVKLNFAVDRDTLTTGESALAMLTVESPEPLKVKKVEIHLIGKESTVAHSHPDSHEYKYTLGQIDTPGVISSESVHEFDLTIPDNIGPVSQMGRNYSVAWHIQIQIHIPWAKDAFIKAPIRIV